MTLNIPQRRTAVLLTIALLLAVPFIAMQFTREVSWTIGDFLVAGGLLLLAGFAGEWILRAPFRKSYRLLLFLGVMGILAIIWVELAVGVFGTPFAGS